MKRPPATRYFCCYCKRGLTPAEPQGPLSFTLDHVNALSRGGYRRVPCCRQCNQLKGDLHMDDWFWFIRSFARWWKTFDTTRQVEDKIREERVRRAWAKLHGERFA